MCQAVQNLEHVSPLPGVPGAAAAGASRERCLWHQIHHGKPKTHLEFGHLCVPQSSGWLQEVQEDILAGSTCCSLPIAAGRPTGAQDHQGDCDRMTEGLWHMRSS